MTEFRSSGRYRAAADVIETDLGDELILLDPRTREMFSLNETGRAIWRALDGRPLEAVRTAILDTFDVAPDAAAEAVHALTAELLEAGLIVEDDAAAR